MKKYLLLAALLTIGALAPAQEPNTARRPEQTILLYERSAPDLHDPVQGDIVPAGFRAVYSNALTAEETYNSWGDIRNISRFARFDLYLPRRCNGGLVLILPGGGYEYVSAYNEGIYAAEWLTRRGFAAAVVKYRLPNGHWEVPLEDVRNAMLYCRNHAADWGVRKIGVLGGSAGGHLAALASVSEAEGPVRPDFTVLLYPVISMKPGLTHNGTMRNITGGSPRLIEELSLAERVTAHTPPTYIAYSEDDKVVNPRNSLDYCDRLRQCGVPVEITGFPVGNHGWGFYSSDYGRDRLGEECRAQFQITLYDFLTKQIL